MCDLNPLYLVKVEAGANNNRYYRMIPLGSEFKVEYGKIGFTTFQTAQYSISQWDKKLREKLKKGYVDQSRLIAETNMTKIKKEYKDIDNPSI